ADGPSGVQEATCRFAREIGQKITRVMQYRRNNAARTVSGSGYRAATSGLLLIDSKGLQGHPFQRRKPGRRTRATAEDLGIELWRTAANLQPTGQNPLRRDAIGHALAHNIPHQI